MIVVGVNDGVVGLDLQDLYGFVFYFLDVEELACLVAEIDDFVLY